MTTHSTNTKIVGNSFKTGFHDHLPGVLFQVIKSNLEHSPKNGSSLENLVANGTDPNHQLPNRWIA